jgi:nitrous oxidase accessory protein NosD
MKPTMYRSIGLLCGAILLTVLPSHRGQGTERWVPATYPTVGAAIADAANGDTIRIAPGVYPEHVIVSHSLTLLGPNAGVDPAAGVRGPEAVLTAAFNDTLAGAIITVDASDVILNGLSIDGDNSTIGSGAALGGADVNAAYGVTNDTTNFPAVARLSVKYCIIRNCTRVGVRLRTTGASAPASSGSTIAFNRIDNISSPDLAGKGIWISYNFYAGINDNTITGVRHGIVSSHFYNPGSPSTIEGNTVEAVETGVWHNLYRQGITSVRLPVFVTRRNRIMPSNGSSGTTGFLVTSIFDTVGVRLEDNTVSTARTGVHIWNCPTKDTVRMVRDTLELSSEGVKVANVHPVFGPGDVASIIVEQSFLLGASGTTTSRAILLKDSSAGTAMVSAALRTNTLINQGQEGIVLEGSRVYLDASSVELSGQTGAYIRLSANDALSKPAGIIDATRIRFEGTTGSGLSDSELSLIESGIIHGSDLEGFGLVRVKPGWVFVTPAPGSLQRGIHLASPGDRIRAYGGTYQESIIVPIPKPGIVLVGDNADRPMGSRTVVESIIRGSVALLSDRSVINGFTLDGGGAFGGDTAGVWLAGGSTGQGVLYCILAGPGQGLRRGILAGYNVDSVQIAGNDISGWTSGMYLNPTPASRGIRIQENRFANNLVGIGSDGVNNTKIRGNTFQNNTLEGWGYSDAGQLGGAGLVADSNAFILNGIGIRNYTSGLLRDTIIARYNTWGSIYGPADSIGSVELPDDPTPELDNMKNAVPAGQLGDGVSGGVIYYPWIGKSVPVVESVVETGWNLMSLSRRPASFNPSIVFPGAGPTVFDYNNETQNTEPATLLDVEHGYWVKFDSSFANQVAGQRVDSIFINVTTPGWVLIGALTDSVPLSSLSTNPTGAINAAVFHYNRTTQLYEPATSITPGEGYWVKVDQPCLVRIRGAS